MFSPDIRTFFGQDIDVFFIGPVAFGSLFKATSTWFPGTVFAVGSFFMICSALTMYFTRLSRLSF